MSSGYATEASLGLVAAASLFGALAALGVTSRLCTLASIGVALTAAAVSYANHRGHGRAALAAAAIPLQVALPALFLAAVARGSGNVIRSPHFVCGNSALGIPFVLAFSWWVGALLSRLALATVAPLRGPIRLGALRITACVFAVGVLALAARGACRARRLPDSPAGWVAVQPVVAEIPPLTQVVTARTAHSDTRRMGGVCIERRCELTLADGVRCRVRATADCGNGGGDLRNVVPSEAALRIRSARRLGAWLVEVAPSGSRSRDVLAFARNPLVQVAYDRGDIDAELAPPRGWIVGGFVAGALALLLALASRARRPFDPTGWQEAWHEGGGRLRVGEATAFAADVASFPVGPVIVRAGQPGGGPFRANAAVDVYDVAAGTLDDAATRADLDAAAPALLALSAASAVGAPLLLAAHIGLS